MLLGWFDLKNTCLLPSAVSFLFGFDLSFVVVVTDKEAISVPNEVVTCLTF